MRKIDWIVVHTAGAYDDERRRVVHQRVEVVRAFHVMPVARYVNGKLVKGTGGRGYKDIGYNRYIEVDGRICLGRPDTVAGAHTEKLNATSLGVCCSGHGDLEPFNERQLNSLVAQCTAWCRLYNLTADRVIGHRETPRFGGAPTLKTCPGKLVDMDEIRARVRDELAGVSRGLVASAPEVDPDDEPPSTRRDGKGRA